MRRRAFLQGLLAIPFLPRSLRDKWEDVIEEEKAQELRAQPADSILGVIFGAPTSLTVIVPPNRRVKITGQAHVTLDSGGIAMLKIMEGRTGLAAHFTSEEEVVTASVTLQPTAGCHTYKLVASQGSIVKSISNPPMLLVENLGEASDPEGI